MNILAFQKWALCRACFRSFAAYLFMFFLTTLWVPPCGFTAAERSLREDAIVRAVRNTTPAVVNISSQQPVRKRANPFSSFGMNPFFDSFFKDFLAPEFPSRQERASLGSGVIIDGRRGYILTNAHVVNRTAAITVTLNDERELKADVVGIDPGSDLAVLHIESDAPLPDIAMGNSADLMIGETVIAIGNPFGFSHTVTTGVVSATNRSIRTDERIFRQFIQTDASINPGNSGGPLLNVLGELVGINTAIYAKAQGIGFAIPINKARRYVDDLIRYGQVVHPWLGIQIQDMDASLARYHQLSSSAGVMVKAVDVTGPAAKAGIQGGDLLLRLGKMPLKSSEDFWSLLRDYSSNQAIEFNVRRGTKTFPAQFQTAAFPLSRAGHLTKELLGVTVGPIETKHRRRLNISADHGVLIEKIQTGYYLSRIGLEKGDVIRRIDDVSVASVEDFHQAIAKKRMQKSMVLLVQRGRSGYYITVEIDPMA